MLQLIGIGMFFIFAYALIKPRNWLNEEQVIDLIASSCEETYKSIVFSFEEYEKERQLAIDDKNPNRETEAFWILKNKLREFPIELRNEFKKAKSS